MRVTARLIDATSAAQIWGQHYDVDRTRDRVFHDEIAQAILLTPDEALLERVAEAMKRQVGAMPRRPAWHS